MNTFSKKLFVVVFRSGFTVESETINNLTFWYKCVKAKAIPWCCNIWKYTLTHPHMHNTKDHIINYADITEKRKHTEHFWEMEKWNWLSAKVCTCFIVSVPCNCVSHTQRNVCTTHAIHTIITTIAFPLVFSPCTYIFNSRQSLEYILRNLMTFSRLVNIIHLSHGYWYNFYKLFASMLCFISYFF